MHLFLAVLSGILICSTFPNVNLFFFIWISLLPLIYIFNNKNTTWSTIFGFIAGFVGNLGLFYWIIPLVQNNTQSYFAAFGALVLLASYMALYFAVWSFLVKFSEKYLSDVYYVFFAASLWVSLEYVRTYIFSGFPGALLGLSQWQFISIIQISAYTGVYGISWLIVLFNFSLALLIFRRKINIFVCTIFVLILILISGYYSINTSNLNHQEKLVNAIIVQPAIDQYKKWDDLYLNEIMQIYSKLASNYQDNKADFVLWPETAVPGYLPVEKNFFNWIWYIIKKTNSYHIIGSLYNIGDTNYYNASLLLNGEGNIISVHKKTHLMPFGEFLPFRKEINFLFNNIIQGYDFNKGTDFNIFTIDSIKIGASICSENFFGDKIRQFVLNGANILVNLNNDAWFFKTAAPEQHFIYNIFRAIENRRPIIVCGNTGVSGVVSKYGIVEKKAPVFKQIVIEASVVPNNKITFYTKYGDIFSKICIIYSLIILLFTIVKLRRNNYDTRFK